VLPIDQVFSGIGGTSTELVKTHREFVADWEESMKLAHDIARKNINKAAAYNKQHFDKHAKAAALQVGDQVLVRNYREKTGKPKMRSYYEENIFKVVEVRSEVPVYKIQSLKKPKDVRVVHRNKLLKVDELPLDVFDKKDESSKKKKSTVKKKKKQKRKENEQGAVQNIEEIEKYLEGGSESDEEFAVVMEQRRGIDSRTPDSTNQETVHTDNMGSQDANMVHEVDVDDLDETVAWDDSAALESLEQTNEENVVVSESDADVETVESDADVETVDSDADVETVDSDAVAETFESGSEVEVVDSESNAENVEESGTDAVDDESEDESEGSEGSPQFKRQSSRRHIPRKMFTYSSLGGNPVREAIT
jgi:hypothetical protein